MLKIAAFALIMLIASVASGADAPKEKPADVWFGAGHISLNATDAAHGFTAQWQFDRADNGDVRIIKEERRGTGKVSGTLMSVCDDQALLLNAIVPARGHELQELNDPVLHLQLVLRVLARAMPAGLPAAGTQTAIDVRDEKNTLRLRKGTSARKDIGAPWQARGTASRDAAGEVRFDLTVTYVTDQPPGGRAELKFTGAWGQQSRMPVPDNAFSLAGWRVHRIDTVAEIVGGNTQFDFVALPAPLKFATLGDVRAAVGRWWSPDVKAPKRAECPL